MQIVVIRAAIRQPVNQPRVAVKGEHDGLVSRENGVEIAIREPVRMFICGSSVIKSTTLTTRILRSGISRRRRSTAARVSSVGTSPQQAITTSGSAPWSLLAQSQMPTPAVQCAMAASMSSHCDAGCLPATMTLT